MKLMIQHVGVSSTDELDSSIENKLIPLEPRMRVEEALVVLAHDPGKSPGYRAAIHVVTPGPDLHVRAEDHTVRAAFNKAMKQVHSRLDMRDRKRTSRLRGRKQKTAHARFGIGRGGS